MKDVFKFASVCSWELLRKSKKYKSRIGEETITDLLQLFLSHHHRQISIKSFSKHEEFKNGADWDWWFISPKKRKYLGIRIQAKTISPDKEEYKVLHYKSGTRPQASELLSSSTKDSMVPLYALYSYWDVAPLLKYAGESDEHFGISLVTLDNILKLKKTKPWKGDKETLKRISSDLVPLYKLLASFNSSKSLTENVFDNLKSELNPRKGMFSRTRTRPGVTEQLPKSIMRLLEYNDNLSDINYEGLFEADRITLFVVTEN